jgi:hypothetical protein
VPGLTGACRYQALDDLRPRWLALYELDSPAVLDSAEYKAVAEGGSDRDKFIMSHLPTLDRAARRYRLIGPAPLGGPGVGFLSLHELAGPSVLEDPGYRAAVSTPWRDRIVSGALSRERRVLRFRNSFS